MSTPSLKNEKVFLFANFVSLRRDRKLSAFALLSIFDILSVVEGLPCYNVFYERALDHRHR